MEALNILALTKSFNKVDMDAAREKVQPGVHTVDMLVRITGTLNVGEDTSKVPTVSIPVKEVLALFIARSGCTREASLALLRECLTEALSQDSKGTGAIEEMVDIDQEFKNAVTSLTSSLPKTPVKGSVKAHLQVSPVLSLLQDGTLQVAAIAPAVQITASPAVKTLKKGKGTQNQIDLPLR